MRFLAFLVLAALLSACGTPPPQVPATPPELLFQDSLFQPPSRRIDASEIFAMSPAMREYLQKEIVPRMRRVGKQAALTEALYKRGGLKLEYDAAWTRTASEAFDARTGNCLSLLIMTAAFARELDLRVEFQSAILEETWSRSGDTLLASGHVNVVLGNPVVEWRSTRPPENVTIDFLPPDEIRGLRTRFISEDMVLSMFMSNRAAEALLAGRLDDAYAWAREAIRRSPEYLSAYNTLGVVYLRHGDLAQAERVFDVVLAEQPQNTRALANLALVYERQGRLGDKDRVRERLARIDPNPPFHFFNQGLDAMRRGEYERARRMFEREVARAEYNHEFHFWLGMASLRLGDVRDADKHLALAVENSHAGRERDAYSAKLGKLRSLRKVH